MKWVESTWRRIRGWFHPDAGAWFLYPGSLFPVSFQDGYGLCCAPWKYHPSTNTLTYQDVKETEVYRLGWLSAQTVVGPRQTVQCEGEQVKDMDAFLSGLRIQTVEASPPPLTVLLQAWSLYDKRWWLIESQLKIEWIDAEAEEHSVYAQEEVRLPLVRVGHRRETMEAGGDLKKN